MRKRVCCSFVRFCYPFVAPTMISECGTASVKALVSFEDMHVTLGLVSGTLEYVGLAVAVAAVGAVLIQQSVAGKCCCFALICV